MVNVLRLCGPTLLLPYGSRTWVGPRRDLRLPSHGPLPGMQAPVLEEPKPTFTQQQFEAAPRTRSGPFARLSTPSSRSCRSQASAWP